MNDGVDHINIYSKGQTKLGRFLSNFTRYKIETEDGSFESVEGYWYWLSCKDDHLRTLWGFSAKQYGREAGAKDWLEEDVFKTKIKKAIEIKILNSSFLEEFKQSTLPFDHYYTYGNKVVRPKEGKWIIEFIEELRKSLTN